jgi:hypothetical protein
VDAEQACRLADIAVRQLQRGLDVAAFGGVEQAIEAEGLALPQALRGSSDDRIAGARRACLSPAPLAASAAARPAGRVRPSSAAAPTICPACLVVRRMTMLRSSRTLPGKA